MLLWLTELHHLHIIVSSLYNWKTHSYWWTLVSLHSCCTMSGPATASSTSTSLLDSSGQTCPSALLWSHALSAELQTFLCLLLFLTQLSLHSHVPSPACRQNPRWGLAWANWCFTEAHSAAAQKLSVRAVSPCLYSGTEAVIWNISHNTTQKHPKTTGACGLYSSTG